MMSFMMEGNENCAHIPKEVITVLFLIISVLLPYKDNDHFVV